MTNTNFEEAFLLGIIKKNNTKEQIEKFLK